VQIFEASSKFEKSNRITIPYPDPRPTKNSNYKISFSPPSQCNVVGSYVSQSMCRSQHRLGIDMVVQMPKSLFQDKDYLDMRYFYRRAYYIAYVAANVAKELGDTIDMNFESLNENPLLPVLVLRSRSEEETKSTKKSASKHDCHIRIIPCAPDDLFPYSKLTPTSANIRGQESDENKKFPAATPFYNSTLNAEQTFIQYLRVLTSAKTECATFTDACILGRIWLQQRGFGGAVSLGGFGHFEWSAMIALLLKSGGRNGQAVLSTSLSATELFKAAIQFLSTTDFNKKPFSFNTTKTSSEAAKEAGPVLFDTARHLNLLFKMNTWSASLLQDYAKSTADLLADDAAPKFEPIFIVKADIPLQIFDAVFEISSFETSKQAELGDRRGVAADLGADVYKVLKKAFGNRAQQVHIRLSGREPWKLNGSPSTHIPCLSVGVVFDAASMARQMEYGPPAEEQKEAAKFRQFWGDKAELRRFKDGSILECVEWSNRMPVRICEEITQYALQRHLKMNKDKVKLHGDGLSTMIGISHLDKEAFDAARRSFQTFEHDVRNLEELPLQIRHLAPVSPLARYASVEAPLVGYHKDSIEPMDVNLYFEASNKWPDNLTAIQEAKIEFLLDLDKRLTNAHDSIKTYLGRENREIGIENLAYLDIVYDSGASFRLRIHCDLEESLLEGQIKNKTLDHKVREDAEQAFVKFNWLFNTLPLHTQTIATYCTRLQALSPTIRLVKHWFAAHKLTGHISEELIELFVLHAFLQPYPWNIPSSVTTGFLRTLFFLSRWDWREDALIIDTSEELTTDERSDIHQELDSWRKRDPNMNHTVMLVATAFDQSGLAYTRDAPSKLIASRMTRLSKAACKLVRDQGTNLDASALFEPALQDYDVLIHLSSKALKSIVRDAGTDSGAYKASQYRNLDGRTGKMPLPVRAGPIDVLVEELQRVYEDTLVFFPGGAADDSIVAALWNPRLQKAQNFRPGLPYNFCTVEQDGDVVEVNRKAVLLEIARIGGSLIRQIEQVEGDND
jgi:U3 small nucleolar RNA-associated protein 22